MWCAVHVKVFRGPLPSVLQVPSCLFLDMGGVSSASAGVYVSRQLLTAQLNLRGLKSDSGRIFMVLTWKSWPFSAHVWNPCWGKELCSFFFFFFQPSFSLMGQICMFVLLILPRLASPDVLQDYQLTALMLISSSVKAATLCLCLCCLTGITHPAAGLP